MATCQKDLGNQFLYCCKDIKLTRDFADKCYCSVCYYGPPVTDTCATNWNNRIIHPRGWFRVGINANPDLTKQSNKHNWSTVYHGTGDLEVINIILATKQLKRAGEVTSAAKVIQAINSAGRQTDGVVYTTPTIAYAGIKFYCKPHDWTNSEGEKYSTSIVFQCLQQTNAATVLRHDPIAQEDKPVFSSQGETMAFYGPTAYPMNRGKLEKRTELEADLHHIEYMTTQTDLITVTGMLLRTFPTEADPNHKRYMMLERV